MKRKLYLAVGIAFAAVCSTATVLFASCAKTEYTVSFDAGVGTSIQSVTATSGEKISEPAALSDGEHIFIGWFNGDKKWDFDEDKVTSSITLTAEWTSGYTENLRYTFYGTYYAVSGYGECRDKNITVCPEYKGYPVKEIENFAFSGCKSILSIYVPDCVDYVGTYAFDRCSSLVYARLSDGITTTLGTYVFANCSSLEKSNIPCEITYLPEGFFYNCSSLIDFGGFEKVERIEPYSFYGCSSLASVDFGDVVTTVGEYTFYNCKSLKSVVLPENIISVGGDCFRGCKFLVSAVFNCAEGTVGDRCFFECVSLKSVYVGGKMTEIGERAFGYCSSLTDIYLSEYVKKIGDNAFRSCGALKKFTYGGSSSAFSSVKIGDGNEKLLTATRVYGK